MSGSAPRILIVDNEPESAARSRAFLEEEGFHVEVSDGGSGAALGLAQAFRPWVILARHDVPTMNGIELCKLVKSDSETSQICLILSCAREPNEVLTVEALQAGANVVLGGPLNQQVLAAHIHSQLNVFQLVMELREKNEFIRGLVQRDPLTGLFNHAHFHELIEREIARGERSKSPVSILFINVDNFKSVNDTHGHQLGDYVLKAAAELMQVGGRRTDAVCRRGGDEFVIILPDTSSAGAAARAESIRKNMAAAAFSDRRLPAISLSFGVASYPEDGTTRSQLIASADRALYTAKRIGGGRVVSFRADLGSGSSTISSAPELERLLAIADVIEKRMATFAYQPIVWCKTGEIFAHEALCRPQHPAFRHAGLLFETAEHAGRIVELGRVLRTISTAPLPNLEPPALLFLNLHPFELNEDLVKEATTIFGNWAGRIVFEITESSQIHDYERRRGLIGQLREAGFRIAVDDLGAGYAGLNSVALLRPDVVKLDMSLIRGIQHDTSAARLIQHIIDFAENEGILVVAEGVETQEEARVVLELGCPLVQGYLLAKPGPPFPTVTTKIAG